MTTNDWVLFVFTFVTGVVAGMYFYTMDFRPSYSLENLLERETDTSEFAVFGKAYGGMHVEGYVHPSFLIGAGGRYEYFAGGVNADQSEPQKEKLPRMLFKDLQAALERADLYGLSLQTQKEYCNTYIDGIDYVYRVTYKGTQYELDTCRSSMAYENELAVLLQDTWAYFEGYDYIPSGSGAQERSMHFMESWLREQFDWQEGRDQERTPSTPDQPTACTMEAMICPDGSAVGRTGPNCEFAPCPGG
ncbi:MAG: hypothetical protein WDZ75_00100 [Candidatus Paceibacterota bacterium]